MELAPVWSCGRITGCCDPCGNAIGSNHTFIVPIVPIVPVVPTVLVVLTVLMVLVSATGVHHCCHALKAHQTDATCDGARARPEARAEARATTTLVAVA